MGVTGSERPSDLPKVSQLLVKEAAASELYGVSSCPLGKIRTVDVPWPGGYFHANSCSFEASLEVRLSVP